MTLLEINKRIKQRPPFQMIERLTSFEAGKSAVGIKCVSVNEPYFQGHMPVTPIMPGVLLIESAAQLCSLIFSESKVEEDKIYVLLKVGDFKFVKPVIPGDRLEIKGECVRSNAAFSECKVEISCDGQIRAKGSLTFTKVDRSSIYPDEA